MDDDLIKCARRTGLSDGYYGYPADPRDFTGAERKAYLDAHDEGAIKGKRIDREDRAYFQAQGGI